MNSLLPFAFDLFTSAQRQPPPIIVKIIEPKTEPTSIADILIGALGLTGTIALVALVLGLAVASVLFLVRSRHPLK